MVFSPPLMLYRLGNFLFRCHIPILPSIICWTNRLLFGCFLPSSASLGANVILGYWALGIVIHKNAVIGDHCWIMQNVTIGRKAGVKLPPRLGKNVAVGAGAVILGDICIGDNTIIGANSVVTKSFPENSVIAGVPARIIRTLDSAEVGNCHYADR